MIKKIALLVLVLAVPLTSMAAVNRLLTVDTPYVDTDHLIKLSLLSFRPTDLQINLGFLDDFLTVSANSAIPLWLVHMPNFGAKAAINIKPIRLTVGASVNYIAFTGQEQALQLLKDNADLPPEIDINAISLNFSAARIDVMAALDLSIIRLYGILDFQIFGMGSVQNDRTTMSTYFHPTVGADIQLGKIMAIFAEIGYYVPLGETENLLPTDEELKSAGAFNVADVNEFTAGVGVEFDLSVFNIRLGVQYPGLDIKLVEDDPSTHFTLPVVPYLNLSLQF